MTNWGWLTPLGVICAALIAGAFLTWNNRQLPHDTLKSLVDIYDKLPDSEARTGLLREIERRLDALNSKSGREDETPFEREFGNETRWQSRAASAGATIGTIVGLAASAGAIILPFFLN